MEKNKKYIGYCYDYILQVDKKTFEEFNENPCNIFYRNNKYIIHYKKQISDDMYEVYLKQLKYTKYNNPKYKKINNNNK